MVNKRHVKRLMSVFDLSDCESLKFPKGASSRVMLLYDEEENRKEFARLRPWVSIRLEPFGPELTVEG